LSLEVGNLYLQEGRLKRFRLIYLDLERLVLITDKNAKNNCGQVCWVKRYGSLRQFNINPNLLP